MALLEVNSLNITAKFKYTTAPVVRDISFSIEAGKSLAIVGESGCGKTMTAQALLGILPENCTASGDLNLAGYNLLCLTTRQKRALRGNKIIFIPQNGYDSLNPVLKIKTHIYETLNKLGIKKKTDKYETAIKLLKQAGLEDATRIMDLYPMALSGGMAQRVVFALGLAGNPDLVIADEPTRGIDEEGEIEYIDMLNKSFPNSAIIIITHSLSVAQKCDTVMVMHSGLTMEYGSSELVFSEFSHPYTKCLLEALPENNLNVAPIKNITTFNTGCPCYYLCNNATKKCISTVPPLLIKDGVYRRCFFA